MRKFLSFILIFIMLCPTLSAAAVSNDVYCRINDSTVTQINTKHPGVQTVGDTTYHVGVGEVLHYDTHETYTEGTMPGKDNSITAGGYGWIKPSSETRPVYQKDENGDTAAVFAMKAGQTSQMAYYNFCKGTGLSGQVALEYKVKADVATDVDFRLISSGANQNGWDNKYQLVYGFLKFSENDFNYQNVSRKEDNSDDNIKGHHVALGLNEWITLRFDLNIPSECYDIYVNGDLLAADLPFHYATLPESLRTDEQKAVSSLGYLRIREAKLEGNVYFDDIAVYDTDSSTTNYFVPLSSVPTYTYDTGTTLTDAKIPVDITDEAGASIGKTAYVPVRMNGLDSSQFAVLKANIDGYSEKATVCINKKVHKVINDFEAYEITDASTGVALATAGHTVQTETLSDGSTNQFMKIYKSASWSNLATGMDMNPGILKFDFGCRVRFPDITGFDEGAKFLSIQLNQGSNQSIVNVNIEPEYGETVAGTRKQLVVQLSANSDKSFAGKKYSTSAPYSTDWSQWHDILIRLENGKMQLQFDGKILTADNKGVEWEQVRTDINFNNIRLAHRVNAAADIEGVSNIDDIYVITYPEIQKVSDISHTTALGGITAPETVLATLTDGTLATLPIRSLTPMGEAPAIENITQCGTYQYTVVAEGVDKTSLLTLTVIDKAYSIGTPYTDPNTGHAVVPVFKATTDNDAVSLITAMYQNNRLLDVTILPVSGSGDIVTPLMPKDGATVKAFLWNDTASLTPACSAEEEVLTAVIPETIEQYDIVCWGDSLTYGRIEGASPATAYSYPSVLASISGKTVKNMGIGGEMAQTIAARQGGLTLAPAGPFTLGGAAGSSVTFTEGSFRDLTGGNIVPRDTGGLAYGWNGTCYLNGIPGKITKLEVDASRKPRKLIKLTFTRLEDGEPLTVNAGQRSIFVPNGNMVKGDINVIFVGENGWHDFDGDGDTDANNWIGDEYDLIGIIDSMIAKTPNPEKTIVIGMQTGNRESRRAMEAAMLAHYGERYINLREYLSSVEILQAAGITPTAEDLEKIAIGAMPKSLWADATDYVHMNATGYRILAEKVYETMQTLGFLE